MSTLGCMCFIHRTDIKKLLSFISLCFFSTASFSAVFAADGALSQPAFIADDERIEEKVPYLTLRWELAEDAPEDAKAEFELEVASSPDFADSTLRYRGPDTASFVSGLAEGDYFFRVRSVNDTAASAWSDPLHARIQYDSLARAFLLFGIGGAVTAATVALVVVGDRQTKKEAAAA